MPAPTAGAGGGTTTPALTPPRGGPSLGGGEAGPFIGGPGIGLVGPGQGGPGYPGNTPGYGPGFNLPKILTPGAGPNGPQMIDSRKMLYSVGEGSTVPYGPTNGYAASDHGVTGFIGPAAGYAYPAAAWFVRVTGSNANGGTTTSATPLVTGTTMTATANSTTVSDAGAAFTSALVGHGICINGIVGGLLYARILQVTDATHLVISNPPASTAGGCTYAIGGAWASPAPFLGSNLYNNGTCGVLSGDTVYIGAGVYRVTYTVGPNLGALWKSGVAAPINPNYYFNGVVNIVGDVTGQYTGDAGMVQLTAYTTNDKTAPSSTTLLNLNGKSNLAFRNIMWVQGNAPNFNTTNSQNITLQDCAFVAPGSASSATMVVAATATVGGFGALFMNWLIDRCLFFASGNAILSLQFAQNNYTDYSANFTVQNSVLLLPQTTSFSVASSGGGSGVHFGGGLIVRNCTFVGGANAVLAGGNTSSVFPFLVSDCFIFTPRGAALQANILGQLVENYNEIQALTARTNVAVGPNSDTTPYAPLFHFGQERIWLPPLFRPFGEPMAGSPLLGFGSDGAQTGYDLRGVLNPRPAGGSSNLPAVGALERADTFITDPSPIGSDTTPMKLTGPGYQDVLLPIGVTEVGQARTVTVKVQYDTNYLPSQMNPYYPALILVAKPQMGVTQQTVYAPSGQAGTPQTLTLASFTPSASGVLNLRLVSYDESGASVVEWDSLAVA